MINLHIARSGTDYIDYLISNNKYLTMVGNKHRNLTHTLIHQLTIKKVNTFSKNYIKMVY